MWNGNVLGSMNDLCVLGSMNDLYIFFLWLFYWRLGFKLIRYCLFNFERHEFLWLERMDRSWLLMLWLFILLIWTILITLTACCLARTTMRLRLTYLLSLFICHLDTGLIELLTILYYLPNTFFTWQFRLRFICLFALFFPKLLKNLNICFFKRVWISFNILNFNYFCVWWTAIVHLSN